MEKLREASSLHASDFATARRWIWSSLYGVADLATKRLFRYSAEQLFWKHMPVVPRRPISWPTRKQSTLSRAIGFGSRMNSRTFGRAKQPWDVQPLATWSRSSRQMRSRAPRLGSSGSIHYMLPSKWTWTAADE